MGNRPKAKIGPLQLRKEFSDPLLDVSRPIRKSKKDVYSSDGDDDYVIQVIGTEPYSLTLRGIVVDSQLDVVDELPDNNPHLLRHGRWSGKVLVNDPKTSPRKERYDGAWLYDITLDMTGLQKNGGAGESDIPIQL